MKIWLDDIRPPPDESWTWVKTVLIVKMMIASGNVFEISLDNDLGEGEEEGYKVLDWLEDVFNAIYGRSFPKLRMPKVHIHTSNPAAAKRMKVVADRLEKFRVKGMFENQ